LILENDMGAARADKPKKQENLRENKDLENALHVLKTEAAGITALAESLDESFSEAVSAIAALRDSKGPGRSVITGRLIVAGIGKSGHVARKIVATLASTGTPSHFVHPGEASHGDLGMVTEDDIVLLLSNSGESAELSDMIHYTRRFGIKLIALTGNADGALAKHADIVLKLPKAPEACPNGLAPTTSTTMMLALGDALAVALLDRMGLTPEQFKVFHPGGKLGQKLLTVADLMHKFDDLPLVEDGAKMGEAIIVMTQKNIGCVLVVTGRDRRTLKGIITEGDLRRHMAPDLLEKPVTKVMTAGPRTIADDALAVEAMNVMTRTPGKYLTSLIVIDAQGRLNGLIRLQDCLQAGIA
jgi:arabinose-5-phosphate isomerase